jgi:hypothetical protein
MLPSLIIYLHDLKLLWPPWGQGTRDVTSCVTCCITRCITRRVGYRVIQGLWELRAQSSRAYELC